MFLINNWTAIVILSSINFKILLSVISFIEPKSLNIIP